MLWWWLRWRLSSATECAIQWIRLNIGAMESTSTAAAAATATHQRQQQQQVERERTADVSWLFIIHYFCTWEPGGRKGGHFSREQSNILTRRVVLKTKKKNTIFQIQISKKFAKMYLWDKQWMEMYLRDKLWIEMYLWDKRTCISQFRSTK